MSAEVINFDFARECRRQNLSRDDIRCWIDRELRRLDAETTVKRSRINRLLTCINEDVEHLRPSDSPAGEP